MTEYLAFETVPDQPYVDQMYRLHDSIFAGGRSTSVTGELLKRSRFLVLLAVESDIVVGYKSVMRFGIYRKNKSSLKLPTISPPKV